jgi:hypothetical protein
MAENISPHQERLQWATEQGRLIEFVNELKAEGMTQRHIYDLLDQYRYELDQQGRESEANYLSDISDRVWGYCRPELRFFDTVLSRE